MYTPSLSLLRLLLLYNIALALPYPPLGAVGSGVFPGKATVYFYKPDNCLALKEQVLALHQDKTALDKAAIECKSHHLSADAGMGSRELM